MSKEIKSTQKKKSPTKGVAKKRVGGWFVPAKYSSVGEYLMMDRDFPTGGGQIDYIGTKKVFTSTPEYLRILEKWHRRTIRELPFAIKKDREIVRAYEKVMGVSQLEQLSARIETLEKRWTREAEKLDKLVEDLRPLREKKAARGLSASEERKFEQLRRAWELGRRWALSPINAQIKEISAVISAWSAAKERNERNRAELKYAREQAQYFKTGNIEKIDLNPYNWTIKFKNL